MINQCIILAYVLENTEHDNKWFPNKMKNAKTNDYNNNNVSAEHNCIVFGRAYAQ